MEHLLIRLKASKLNNESMIASLASGAKNLRYQFVHVPAMYYKHVDRIPASFDSEGVAILSRFPVSMIVYSFVVV
jgi:hypothetical protein